MLHFFGCSLTWGDELKKRHEERFSTLLSKKVNQHSRNYSRPGNDDFTSINTFFRFYNAGYIQPNDYVFFQWSGINRHGIPFGDTVIQYPWLKTGLSNWDSRDLQEQQAAINYAHYLNDVPIQTLNKNIRQMFSIFSLSLPFKVINFLGDDKTLFTDGYPPTWLKDSMLGYTDGNNIPRARNGHPNRIGHATWAAYLYKHVFENTSSII